MTSSLAAQIQPEGPDVGRLFLPSSDSFACSLLGVEAKQLLRDIRRMSLLVNTAGGEIREGSRKGASDDS